MGRPRWNQQAAAGRTGERLLLLCQRDAAGGNIDERTILGGSETDGRSGALQGKQISEISLVMMEQRRHHIRCITCDHGGERQRSGPCDRRERSLR